MRPSSPSLGRAYPWRFLAALMGALALILLIGAPATILAAPSTTQQSAHPSDSGINYVRDLDSPAIVRIVSEVDAQVVCAGCSSDGSNYIFPDTQHIYPVELSGSGAFISADGYILTAFHVVDLNCNDNFDNIVSYWESDLQSNYQNYGFSSSDSALQFAQNVLNGNQISVQCSNSGFSQVFPSSAYQGQLNSPGSLAGYRVTQVVQSSPVNQQDTAIVKVDIPHDMPYLTLASASQVQTGETVTALAFPGDADQSSFSLLLLPSDTDVNTITNLITPSVDTGQITTQQTLSNGTLTYETSGIAYHGSSGGPAVDDQGRVVGFFDYTTDTQNNRVVVLVSSSVAATYANQAGLSTPHVGTVQPAWAKAMQDYYGSGPCHFGNALDDLQQLKNLHPEFGGVQSFLLTAQQKQTPQACAASLQHGPPAWLIVLLVVIALAIVGGVLVFSRRRAVGAPTPALVGAVAQRFRSITPAARPPTVPDDLSAAASPSREATTIPSGIFAPTPTPPEPQRIEPPAEEHSTDVPDVPVATATAEPTPEPLVRRVCPNGHAVEDTHARFCPECGAPLGEDPTQP